MRARGYMAGRGGATAVLAVACCAMAFALPARALSVEPITCEMPGAGQAAYLISFDDRYVLFQWIDEKGAPDFAPTVVYADCDAGTMLRVTGDTDEIQSGASALILDEAQEGRGRDLAELKGKLASVGIAAETAELPADHCVCTQAMMDISGQ